MRIPSHIGIIPDGNRRWAMANNLMKYEGYDFGLKKGLEAFLMCKEIGVKEVTFYGFTKENTKRAKEQTNSFIKNCVNAVDLIKKYDCEILVVGDSDSKMFPKSLLEFTNRKIIGKGGIKVNFLINYSWGWDLKNIKNISNSKFLNSEDISRVDLIIRWGGMRRLSGFLPIQSAYSDFYVVENFWPDYKNQDILDAISWYNKQDITLGG